MASPGDEIAAGAESHTRLRASAADREHALPPGAGAAAIPYMAGGDAENRTVAGADVTNSLRPGSPRTGFISR